MSDATFERARRHDAMRPTRGPTARRRRAPSGAASHKMRRLAGSDRKWRVLTAPRLSAARPPLGRRASARARIWGGRWTRRCLGDRPRRAALSCAPRRAAPRPAGNLFCLYMVSLSVVPKRDRGARRRREGARKRPQDAGVHRYASERPRERRALYTARQNQSNPARFFFFPLFFSSVYIGSGTKVRTRRGPARAGDR